MAAMKSSISGLALLCFCLVSWTAAAETDKRHPAAIAPQSALLTFQTLDGATQQVNPDEIWRIRATSASGEPPGAIVIDYGFERVYVKENLRQRGGEGGRRKAFEEIYPAGRSASLHRCRQGDRRHPLHPASASPECPCDHRRARRPDPGSGNARSHQRSAGEIGRLRRAEGFALALGRGGIEGSRVFVTAVHVAPGELTRSRRR